MTPAEKPRLRKRDSGSTAEPSRAWRRRQCSVKTSSSPPPAAMGNHSQAGHPSVRPSTSGTIRHSTAALSSTRSEEHTSELQSRGHLVCRLLLEKKNNKK